MSVNKAKYSQDQIDYFWSKVDIKSKSKCWNWLGAKATNGYGNVRIDKAYLKAHREGLLLKIE